MTGLFFYYHLNSQALGLELLLRRDEGRLGASDDVGKGDVELLVKVANVLAKDVVEGNVLLCICIEPFAPTLGCECRDVDVNGCNGKLVAVDLALEVVQLKLKGVDRLLLLIALLLLLLKSGGGALDSGPWWLCGVFLALELLDPLRNGRAQGVVFREAIALVRGELGLETSSQLGERRCA